MKEITVIVSEENYVKLLQGFHIKFNQPNKTDIEKHEFVLTKLKEYAQRIVIEAFEQEALKQIRAQAKDNLFEEKKA